MKVSKILIDQNLYEDINFNELFFIFSIQNGSKRIKVNLLQDFNLSEDLIEHNVLNKREIIENGMAKETPKFYSHLGNFMVYPNLSAYYKLVEDYIIIYGFGEVQNGRNILYISGVWKIDNNFI